MSMHDYENSVGMTWRDKSLTRDDLTVQQIADYIHEKRVILSTSLWGRYKHRGRHHRPNIFQRAYMNLVMAWTPTFS